MTSVVRAHSAKETERNSLANGQGSISRQLDARDATFRAPTGCLELPATTFSVTSKPPVTIIQQVVVGAKTLVLVQVQMLYTRETPFDPHKGTITA